MADPTTQVTEVSGPSDNIYVFGRWMRRPPDCAPEAPRPPAKPDGSDHAQTKNLGTPVVSFSPFYFGGLLTKAEHERKRVPLRVTGEPRNRKRLRAMHGREKPEHDCIPLAPRADVEEKPPDTGYLN